MANQLKSGFMIGPDGKVVPVTTPQERVAQMNNQGALERTQITQQGMDRRASSTGGGKARWQEVSVEQRDPRTGAITTTKRYLPVEEDPSVMNPSVEQGGIINDAPMVDQNQPPADEAMQSAIQTFDENAAMRGFDKVSPMTLQADGTYIVDIARRGDTVNPPMTYQILPDGSSRRIR